MITTHHSKQLAFSPAYTFVFKGYVAMLEEQLTHPCLEFGNQHEVVYARDTISDQIVCAQLFAVDKMGRVFTQYAYTLPEFRNQGLATKIFEHLEHLVKKRLGNDLNVIYTSAVDDNENIKSVFAKTGRDHFTSRFVKFFERASG